MASALIRIWETTRDGQIRVVWEDGHSNLFLDLAHIRYMVDARKMDRAEEMALDRALSELGRGGDVRQVVEGKRVTLDWADPQPVKVEAVAAVPIEADAEVKP